MTDNRPAWRRWAEVPWRAEGRNIVTDEPRHAGHDPIQTVVARSMVHADGLEKYIVELHNAVVSSETSTPLRQETTGLDHKTPSELAEVALLAFDPTHPRYRDNLATKAVGAIALRQLAAAVTGAAADGRHTIRHSHGGGLHDHVLSQPGEPR